ncbi:MAG: hypothetical protein ACRDCE_04535, partial [Cetobacterium sp.]|uniref:hypothetical protein n=1 Tax=Cetobacterium sp. TaxID=2071632 RepID=UPI003EE6A427
NTRLENLEARPTFDDEYKTKIDDLEARPQFTDEYKTKIDDLEARPQFTDSDKELIDGLTNGETWISPKCISTPTSLISNATPSTVTMDQVAQGQTIVLNGSASVTVRLCKVVSVSMANIQTDEVKSGTEIKIYNFGTSDAQIESNTAGIDMVGFGSTGSTRIRTLPTGKYAKFMSVSTGSGYGWAYLESGDCPSMT